mgnify:CR=1 FL=1
MISENGYLQRKSLRKSRKVQVMIFFVVLYVIAVVSLIIPLRPTQSETEQRTLTKFPTFSFASLWDGSYFQQIDLWFSDTFPFRETLISWNTELWNLSGIHTNTIHGEVQAGDEIPSVGDITKTQAASGTSTTTTSSTTQTTTTTTKSSGGDNPDGTGEQIGAIWIAGNSGYEYYTFSRSVSDRYVNLLNQVGNRLAGKANVYDIIVPNSMGVMLSDEYKQEKGITTSDQKQAIAYMSASMNDNVKSVSIFDTLRSHWKDYIYFRTDHHWTATGAYYAYEEFAKVKGFTPTPLEDYESHEYDGFLGTFYADSKMSSALGKTPDTVVTYTPTSTNDIRITGRDGNEFDWKIVMDVSDYNSSGKYSAFIGGDNPFSVIENPKRKDGSSCVVIKESYGNAFVPFLVDHYQTVYVVDYRYYEENVLDFVTENKIQDVIFINNIMATSTDQRVQEMYDITGVS